MKRLSQNELERIWRRLRLELYRLAEGATTNYDPQTGHVKPSSKSPPRRGEDIIELEHRWDKARSRKAKQEVIWDALTYLFLDSPPDAKRAALAYMPEDRRDQLRKLTIKQMRGTRDWKRLIACEPGPLRKVARTFGVSADTVSRYRKQFAEVTESNGYHLPTDASTLLFVKRVLESAE